MLLPYVENLQAKQGKSTLINTLLGFEIDANGNYPPGAAAVDEAGVCTTEPEPFRNPNNENIVYWDLPGVDGSKFKLAEYFELIGAWHRYLNPDGERLYDYLLIVISDVLGNDAARLVEMGMEFGIKWYLVRTHIDLTIMKGKRMRKKPEEIVKTVRQRLVDQLKDKKMTELIHFKLYLVDATSHEEYELPKLMKDLAKDCQREKRLLLLKHTRDLGAKTIDMKFEELKLRIPKVARASSTRLMTKSLSFKKPEEILIGELLYYLQVFHLLKQDILDYESGHNARIAEQIDNCFGRECEMLFVLRSLAPDLRSSNSLEALNSTVATILRDKLQVRNIDEESVQVAETDETFLDPSKLKIGDPSSAQETKARLKITGCSFAAANCGVIIIAAFIGSTVLLSGGGLAVPALISIGGSILWRYNWSRKRYEHKIGGYLDSARFIAMKTLQLKVRGTMRRP